MPLRGNKSGFYFVMFSLINCQERVFWLCFIRVRGLALFCGELITAAAGSNLLTLHHLPFLSQYMIEGRDLVYLMSPADFSTREGREIGETAVDLCNGRTASPLSGNGLMVGLGIEKKMVSRNIICILKKSLTRSQKILPFLFLLVSWS